jgi:hypothetical protein
MDRRIGAATAVVLMVVTGGVWGATRAETSPAGSPEIVTIDQGAVSVTVGGIGHVTTLSDAARLATNPAADTAGVPLASSGAVFATVTGHVTELLVAVGRAIDFPVVLVHRRDSEEAVTTHRASIKGAAGYARRPPSPPFGATRRSRDLRSPRRCARRPDR